MCMSAVRQWALEATMKEDLDDVDVGEAEDLGEDGVVGHFVAIFTFSFLVSLVMLHTSILWQRVHFHGDSFQFPQRSVERMMARYYGFDYYASPHHFDLAVNTTYFIH